MSIFNSEQSKLTACKKELQGKTTLELEAIANRTTKTAFLLSNGKEKHYQIAAYQLLRERANQNKG